MLNPDQRTAASAVDGVYVVVAGPGAGKTRVVVHRFLEMITKGIPSSDMLNLTFTAAAAAEMVKRVGIEDAETVFRTFHSFAIDLLKKEKQHLPFKVCDTIIPVAMQDYELLFQLAKTYPTIKNWRLLQERIADWKKSNVTPDNAMKVAQGLDFFMAAAYKDYETKCRAEGWLDFDSVMYETVKLLESNPEVKARHQRNYITVDECQDTDVVQFRLLQHLFKGNIFVVGDENQLIYEWRSAQPGNLSNFVRMFPGAEMLYLGQNYRSTKQIVEFLKEILPVDNGLASRMVTENEEGIRPTIIKYSDADQEAERVLSKIGEGEDTAIIARTNRQLFVFQRLCTMRSIKYRILGKKDFWEQNEVKKLLHLAKGVHDPRSADQVLSSLIHDHNLLEIYRHSGRPMESSPAENLNSIVKMAAGKGNITDFLDYLRKLTRARKSSKAGLTLSTVHQAKGREWNNVFVIGANQDTMPHKEGTLAEESRIFFVACSRAAKTLEISYYKQMSQFYQHRSNEIKMYTGETDGIPVHQQ